MSESDKDKENRWTPEEEARLRRFFEDLGKGAYTRPRKEVNPLSALKDIESDNTPSTPEDRKKAKDALSKLEDIEKNEESRAKKFVRRTMGATGKSIMTGERLARVVGKSAGQALLEQQHRQKPARYTTTRVPSRFRESVSKEPTMANLNVRSELKRSLKDEPDNLLVLDALKSYIDSLPDEAEIEAFVPSDTAKLWRRIHGVDVLINRALEKLSGGDRERRHRILELLETEKYGRMYGLMSFIEDNPEYEKMIDASISPESHQLLGMAEQADLEWEPLEDEEELRKIAVSSEMLLADRNLRQLIGNEGFYGGPMEERSQAGSPVSVSAPASGPPVMMGQQSAQSSPQTGEQSSPSEPVVLEEAPVGGIACPNCPCGRCGTGMDGCGQCARGRCHCKQCARGFCESARCGCGSQVMNSPVQEVHEYLNEGRM